MKKKKIILSTVGLLFSIAMMMFGVYSAINPNVSVTGTVTYTVYDARVLVRGRIEDAKTYDGTEDVHADSYPEINTTDYKQSTKVNTPSQYLSFTTGEGVNNDTDNLETWNFGDLSFFEDVQGVTQIKMYLEVTNFSPYPVNVALTFGNTDAIQASNITRGVSKDNLALTENGGKDEIVITYDVNDIKQEVEKLVISNILTVNQATPQPAPEPTLTNWSAKYDSDLEGLVLTNYSGTETDIVIPSELDTNTLENYDDSALTQVSANINGLNLSKFASGNVLSVVGVEGSSNTSIFGNNGSNIETLILPENIKKIGQYAFYGCSLLETITIPEKVTYIGKYAFYDNVSLTKIDFNATDVSDLEYKNYTFANAGQNGTGIVVNISSNVTKIPTFLFSPYNTGCLPKITNVNFEQNSVCNDIGNRAFSYCKALESINIPDCVTTIGDYAFKDCSSLKTFKIPESAISIGHCAFDSCGEFTSITIPASVTSIGLAAFSGSKYLTEIIFNATALDDLKSSNEVFSYAGQNGEGITVTIGANVTKIPAYLFSPYGHTDYLPKITSVIFETNSVCNSIGGSAFSMCSSLTNIIIPDSVTSIGSSAFSACSSLTNITIPASVTSIYNSAFDRCSSLTGITFIDSTSTWTANYNLNNTTVSKISVANPSTNLTNFTETYKYYNWTKNV